MMIPFDLFMILSSHQLSTLPYFQQYITKHYFYRVGVIYILIKGLNTVVKLEHDSIPYYLYFTTDFRTSLFRPRQWRSYGGGEDSSPPGTKSQSPRSPALNW